MPDYEYYLGKRKGYTDYSLRMLKEAILREAEKKARGRDSEAKDRLIAKMLAEGRTYREIARALHVSLARVSKVKKMMEAGLIEPP